MFQRITTPLPESASSRMQLRSVACSRAPATSVYGYRRCRLPSPTSVAMTFSRRLPHCVLYGTTTAFLVGPLVVLATRALSTDPPPDVLARGLAAFLADIPLVFGPLIAAPFGMAGGLLLAWCATRIEGHARLAWHAVAIGSAFGVLPLTIASYSDNTLAIGASTIVVFVVAGGCGGVLTWVLAFRGVTPGDASSVETGAYQVRIGDLLRRPIRTLAVILGALLLLPVGAVLLLLFVGVSTGWFERLDERQVRSHQLSTGAPLAQELERRLASHGVELPVRWSTAGFGTSSISTACIQHGIRMVCMAFELVHRGNRISASNPIAASLFPELPVRGMPLGWTLDRTTLAALEGMRRRDGDVLLVPIP